MIIKDVKNKKLKTMYQQKVHPAKRNLINEGIIQIGAGGSAGFVEVCIMHPMDLVKTRFQLQVRMQAADATYYTGVYNTIMKTLVKY